ncbi:MAG: amino acid ABC transporter substrate-binding protein [Firmicutes bacterium]|jgi:polar amino acid transport system substrate-binding protein|nr:amino acid ABC transporter substrate-binding protein [Bacillota bacterium]
MSMSKGKSLWVGLVCTIIAILALGSIGFSAQSEDSLERIRAAGVIRIGVDDAFPPMEYRDEKGNLVGFDVDLANEIGSRLGVDIVWVPTAWDGVILALQSGKFDMIQSTLTITEERAREVDFSPPYIYGAQIIVVKKEEKDINVLSDLKGKVVGTQLGSTGEVAAKKYGGFKDLKLYATYPEAFTDLAIGRIKALVVDEFVGRYYMTKQVGAYRVLEENLAEESIGIGFRKGDVSLREAVCNAIDSIKADGTYAKISEKWFGVDVSK